MRVAVAGGVEDSSHAFRVVGQLQEVVDEGVVVREMAGVDEGVRVEFLFHVWVAPIDGDTAGHQGIDEFFRLVAVSRFVFIHDAEEVAVVVGSLGFQPGGEYKARVVHERACTVDTAFLIEPRDEPVAFVASRVAAYKIAEIPLLKFLGSNRRRLVAGQSAGCGVKKGFLLPPGEAVAAVVFRLGVGERIIVIVEIGLVVFNGNEDFDAGKAFVPESKVAAQQVISLHVVFFREKFDFKVLRKPILEHGCPKSVDFTHADRGLHG